MAKMFYTLEEVCSKLGKGEEEVKEMARSGQLQEFRDRDRLMFKVEQVDLLAGSDEDTGEVQLELADSGLSGSAVGLSGSGMAGKPSKDEPGGVPLSDSREGTGISVFDTGHGEEEASEKTHVGESYGEELTLESVGSGSGLLDLTRESDDTSLGAQLLEEVYSSDEAAELPAHASGLFEAAGTESPGNVVGEMAAAGTMPMFVEAYDGSWSGLGLGLMIGSLAALICAGIIGIVGVGGATPGLATTFAANIWMWVGILAGVTAICGAIGFFIGRATE